VFDGGMAGEPLWKKLWVILKHYGLIFAGLVVFFIFMGVKVNPNDPKSDLQSYCLGVTLMMVCWWLSSAVPLAVTSLLPIVFFPLTGVLSTSVTTAQYANEIAFLLVGAFMLALAMERWKLDKRIVYKFLGFIGTGKKRILAAIMFVTVMLSMWMSNAATALVMIPVVRTVADNVQMAKNNNNYLAKRIEQAYLLGVLYSSTAGGIATPIGTSLNLVTIRAFRQLYPLSPEINFGMWMAMGIPVCIFFSIIAWVILCWRFLFLCGGGSNVDEKDEGYTEMVDDMTTFESQKPKKEEEEGDVQVDANVTDFFQRKAAKLGPMKFAEYLILFCWIIMVFLWIFRADITFAGSCNPWHGCVPGWYRLFTNRLDLPANEAARYVSDAVPILAIVIPLFLLPAGDGKGTKILEWETVKSLPWSVLLLIGSGFALAEAFSKTGLATWMATGLYSGLGNSSMYGVMVVLCMVSLLAAIAATGPAVAAVLVPVFAQLALKDNVHPFMYTIPVTFAISFAFLLPTATPVSAVIFTTQKITIQTLAAYGAFLGLIGLLLVCISWLAIGQFTFRANQPPVPGEWLSAEEVGLAVGPAPSDTAPDIHIGI